MGSYTVDSVQKLNFFDAVRKYPGMYIGSKDADGLHHLPKEILSNSIDEYLNGCCTEIIVTLFEDKKGIRIEDNGRGIPIGEKENGKTALELCFTEEHAGGKFLNATGESGYNSAGGMHGLGTKCVNALSKKMVVSTYQNGKIETIEFEYGNVQKHTVKDSFNKDKHGTVVMFEPDERYLETITFDANRLKTLIQEFSFLCKDLSFTFVDKTEDKITEYISRNGLYDYIEYLNKEKEFLCKPLYFEKEEGTFKIEVAFGYNNSYSPTVKLYTNNIPQIKGTHLTGFKTAFTSTLNSFAREKKWLKEKDENLQGSDFEEGQLLIINFKMIDPVFKGQNKEELSSSEGRTYVQKFSTEALKELFVVNEKEIKKIVDKALNARNAREAAKKAREAVRDTQKKKKEKVLKFDSKLADCWSKDRKKCEIYLVEGDSASGNLKTARENEWQAVMPLRGKVLNVQKAVLNKIQSNVEIRSMIEAFGLKVDLKTMKLTYEPDELRYGKIIIAVDADPDGSHIANLLLTFIWNFCPQLILDGYVYILVPPLFKMIINKEYIYIKNNEDLKIYQAKYKDKQYQLSRFKGLGEMSPEETEEALVNPEKRIIKKVTVDDIEGTNILFEHLMGNSIAARKKFIQEHSKEVKYGI